MRRTRRGAPPQCSAVARNELLIDSINGRCRRGDQRKPPQTARASVVERFQSNSFTMCRMAQSRSTRNKVTAREANRTRP